MLVFFRIPFRTEVVAVLENKLDSKTARGKLNPRREPYWHKLQKGGYLGYRRTEDGGTWIARWRRVDKKQEYTSFGTLDDIGYADQFDEAQKRTRDWFRSLGSVSKTGYTITDAIDDYVKHLKIKNSNASANDADLRLKKHVIPVLGQVRLNKLTLHQVIHWRDALVRISDDLEDVRKSKDGANRILSYFKAALNHAFNKDIIGTDKAWRRVKAFENVGTARKVILDDKQVERLLNKTIGGFHDLIKSGLLTGARYGEIAQAKVADLDIAEGTLHLSGKTGSRDVYLSDTALLHFKNLAKGKLPTAYIHTKDDGQPWGRSHQTRPMQSAVKAARLPADTTFYTLRHTHISRALLAGVNAQVIAENCGTSVRMIEKHYGKFMKSDRRAMFNKVKLA